MSLIKEVEKCATKKEAIELIRERMGEETGIKPDVHEAELWLMRNLPLEKHYQKKIIARIREIFPDAFVWKASAGPYSMGGIPDVCCVIHGRFYGFEIKRPFFGKATALQEQAAEKIRKAGGVAEVVSYPREVESILEKWQEFKEGTS